MPSVTLHGLQVEYTDSGNGLAVVFVPGLSGSKDCFSYQTSGLSDRYRVISYDLRAHQGRAKYDLQLLADDLHTFVRALRLPSIVAAGHSFGGLVALQFALSHPEMCVGLVLASSAPCYPRLGDSDLVGDLMPEKQPAESPFRRLWRRLARLSAAAGRAGAGFRGCSIDPDRATLQARLKILRDTDLSDGLESIHAPTLIVAGAEEEAYVLAGSQLMYQRIPRAFLEVVEGCDQNCYITRYDLFNELVADHLARRVAAV